MLKNIFAWPEGHLNEIENYGASGLILPDYY
jgi:hypothetical protein